MKKLIFGCLTAMLMLIAFSAGAEMMFEDVVCSSDAVYLDLGETCVTDWDAYLQFLDGLPALERVDMFATTVQKEQIDLLTERYPGISFGWTILFADHHVIRTDATAFSTLHYSGDPVHVNEDFQVLRYCTQLCALDIGHNWVDDLSFLYDLPELRVLIVACNRVGDATPIASLKKLEYLEIFSNWLVDIAPLKELPHLVHLNIGYNDISDLSPLYEMPQLKRLWMRKCHSRMTAPPISQEIMDELRRSLPDCQINTTHQPSEGGWREDVYYPVIQEMFQTGIYKPFPDSPDSGL